jgi:hypothetical protein
MKLKLCTLILAVAFGPSACHNSNAVPAPPVAPFGVALGQSLTNAVPMPSPEVQYLDQNGIPLAGAKLCTYQAGTTTPLATYTDSTAGTPNTNPIILDVAGRASVWVGPNIYKFVLLTGGDGTCSTGSVVWSQDNVADSTLYFLNYVKTAGTASLIGYLAPGTGGATDTVQTALTARSVSVVEYGAYCDAVINQTTGAVTSGHDDHVALQAAFNAAGLNGISTILLPAPGLASGPTGTGTTTGLCLTSTTLKIGTGSNSTASSNNAFRIQGVGGAVWSWGGVNGYYLTRGGSSILYTGAALGTTPVLTVAGPIWDITLDGFNVDCRNLAQTCILFTGIRSSYIHDVFAINNLSASAIYNGGFWIGAYQKDFSGGCPGTSNGCFAGTQYNVFDSFGTFSYNGGATGITIGAPDNTGTYFPPGSPSQGIGNDKGYDVSANDFRRPIAQMLGTSPLSTGVDLEFHDGNSYYDGEFAASTPMYFDFRANGGPSYVHCYYCTAATVGGTGGTLAGAIDSSQTTVPITMYGPFPYPSIIWVDVGNSLGGGSEIMWVSSVSGTNPNYTATVSRGIPNGLNAIAHASGTAFAGPYGWALDSSDPAGTGYSSPVAEFVSLDTNEESVSLDETGQGMVNPLLVGVFGTTASGANFQTPYAKVANRMFASKQAYGGTINNVSTLTYFAQVPPPITLPALIASYNPIIGVTAQMSCANTTGSSAILYPDLSIVDATGTSNMGGGPGGGHGFTIAAGVAYGTINLNGQIQVEQPFQKATSGVSYTISGNWIYDDNATAGVSAASALFPYAIKNRSIVSGIQLKLGLDIGTANSGIGCTMNAFKVTVDYPNMLGIF